MAARSSVDAYHLRIREAALWRALCQVYEDRLEGADVTDLLRYCHELRSTLPTAAETTAAARADGGARHLVPFLSREWRRYHRHDGGDDGGDVAVAAAAATEPTTAVAMSTNATSVPSTP